MNHDTDLRVWWDARTAAEQAILRDARDTYPMPTEATVILIKTACPVRPVGVKWVSSQNDYSFNMPNALADLIGEDEAEGPPDNPQG